MLRVAFFDVIEYETKKPLKIRFLFDPKNHEDPAAIHRSLTGAIPARHH